LGLNLLYLDVITPRHDYIIMNDDNIKAGDIVTSEGIRFGEQVKAEN
jgi:hypothetical protein